MGENKYSKGDFKLFCGSGFMTLQDPKLTALDYLRKQILDKDGRAVRIKDVPKYQERLSKDDNFLAWWSGDRTDVNAYFFEEFGGDWCSDDFDETKGNLGGTGSMQPLIQGANGQAENGRYIFGVTLRPNSFDGTERPSTYKEANRLISPETSIARAIPRSVTLLHEAFHISHENTFLSDKEECV